MVRKIFLDTDYLIEILRGNDEVIQELNLLNADIYTSSINEFELWSGRRKNEERELRKFLESVNTLDFDSESSLIAGDIRRGLQKSGKDLDFRDIFIASICIINRISLLTFNKKHFSRMEKFGLELVM